MDALDIVTVIAIILFARLGIRLLGKFLSRNKTNNEDETDT